MNRLLAALGVAGLAAVGIANAAGRPLTVAAAIDTARFMPVQNVYDRNVGPQDVSVSPDGRYYVVRVVRGDLARNGNHLEVLAARTDTLDAAARPQVVATFFSTSYGYVSPLHAPLTPYGSPLVWIDDERVAFLWEDSAATMQVVSVNVRTKALEWLTSHPTDVVFFAVSKQGRIFYAAAEPRSDAASTEMLRNGFVVRSPDISAILRGNVTGASLLDRFRLESFVTGPGQAQPTRTQVAFHWPNALAPRLSPDGRQVIVTAAPDRVDPQWAKYTTGNFPGQYDFIAAALEDRKEWFGRQITQLYIVDLADGSSRPLWNVPTVHPYVMELAWAADSRRILLSPTFMPLDHADAAGLDGKGVAEMDVVSGQVSQLPVTQEAVTGTSGLPRWLAADRIEIKVPNGWQQFVKHDGQWQPDATAQTRQAQPVSAPIRMEIRQTLNTPPVLYAIDARGRERVALNPNPTLLRDYTLGHVERMQWTGAKQREWRGVLYYPVGYAKGRRYPLVVQLHGVPERDEFSLYGKFGSEAPGLGVGWSVYAAQPLANRGIAVLSIETKRDQPGPDEVDVYLDGIETAANRLVDSGLVAREKVGLVGFSRTGWYVEYALTHSDFPFGAAIASDNIDGGYVQSTLNNGMFELENGARPYGEGLQTWLERAPPFNADKVRAPLRLQVESQGLSSIMGPWEMFSRLRRLGRPVELYVIPEIERGSHNVQNPRQSLASKEGAVDWFDFWLNGREDPAPEKAEQYQRWRDLKALPAPQ